MAMAMARQATPPKNELKVEELAKHGFITHALQRYSGCGSVAMVELENLCLGWIQFNGIA